ncbi:MAG: FAD-dependent oxidoreductase [Magnetococcales bacterium]|nr:FAD-dependent oxidoreductase [Magnetococcales bacterium]
MKKAKFVLLIVIFGLIGGFFIFGLGDYLNLEFIKSQRAVIEAFHESHPFKAAGIYFLLYVVVTGLSLPGAVPMTLIGGAIFGLGWGTVLISFASTIGATLAFLASRFLFRETIRTRFGNRIGAIDRGVQKEGAFYLFTLRLVPAFPFFLINLAMGLTALSTPTYFLVSQIGMLPGTLVFVNAGTQLAQIDSISGILSPALMGSFVLLGIFPLIAKKMVALVQARKVLAGYSRPKKFDRNLIVIGAGAAGLVTSYIAAAVKAEVTLIEKHRMGGDCLNTGCVPSKAIIRTAKFLSHAKRASELGLKPVSVDFDFVQVMERVQRVIKTIEPHDSVERYTELGVECLQGAARITSPYHVEVNGKTLSTRNIVIATGARPLVPDIPGLEEMDYLTSDTIWDIREQPKRLLVMGGGPIGCELAQAFSRLGSEVILVQRRDRLMVREDVEISEMVAARFRGEGIDLRLGYTPKAFRWVDGVKTLICVAGGEEVAIEFDQLLLAMGRRANTSGFGLEELGIPVTSKGTVEVNDFLATRFPHIYACGDVAGPYQFTHTAAHQAWYTSVNALFGRFKKFKVDYSVIPWCTFTEPEVARVGLNEIEAKERGIAYEVTTYGIDDLDRAIADEEAHGLVKVLTVPGRDKLLGVTIVGEHGGDLIAEFVLAMRHGLGLNKILGTIHIYPTMAEANKYVAGNWKKAHVSEGVLSWLKKYHTWQRG